jgi:hypothetical protein
MMMAREQLRPPLKAFATKRQFLIPVFEMGWAHDDAERASAEEVREAADKQAWTMEALWL